MQQCILRYSEHEKEMKAANAEIKELKEELQRNKTIAQIELTFEEKKLAAKENAQLRKYFSIALWRPRWGRGRR